MAMVVLWKGVAKYIFEEGVVLHVNSKAYVYATFGKSTPVLQRCSLSNLTFRHVVVAVRQRLRYMGVASLCGLGFDVSSVTAQQFCLLL